MELNEKTIDGLLKVGASQAEIRTAGEGVPFVVVPEGYKLQGLEKLLSIPPQKRRNILRNRAAHKGN